MKKHIIYLLGMLPLFYGCSGNGDKADAYGNFEADEVVISAEANGKLVQFDLEEGDMLSAGQQVGFVDTTQLFLTKKQLEASIGALRAKTQNVKVQIEVFEKQRANLAREKRRVEKLLADSAATSKQYDDISGELDVVNRKIAATKSQLNTSNQGILSEIAPLEAKIEQINDQLQKSIIINPEKGTVLSKYAYANEITAFGKPLYKIADLQNITLRAYVSGTQLASVKIGSSVRVMIDDTEGAKEYQGKISWVSANAEFTPKVIQTKEERVNLVYAIKVLVKNDGSLKIGMPGEVYF